MTARTIVDVVDAFREELFIVDPIPIWVTLGSLIANHLPGDPVWLLVVGPPSSGKTEIISSLSGLDDVHEVSTFTEAALLSGSQSRNYERSGGLLRQFRPHPAFGNLGILTFKDFTSIISEAADTRQGLLAALREIYDGRWIRHLGTDGGRTLAWAGKAGVIGAVTETIDRQTAVMGAMGERFILVRMPTLDDDQRLQQGRRALRNRGRETNLRAALSGAVQGLLGAVDLHQDPGAEPVDMAVLADFASRCRSPIETAGPYRQLDLVPQPEQVSRLALVLAQLDYGMSVGGLGPKKRADALRRVALDSIPKHRLQILTAILERPSAAWTAAALADRTGLGDSAMVGQHLVALGAHRVLICQSGDRGVWAPSPWLTDRQSLFVTPGASDGRP